MNIFKVLPDLQKSKHLKLFHLAARSQFAADEFDWEAPRRLTKPHLRRQLGRALTPILMGEQSAFYSLSTIIPILGREMEVESQMFLSSMAMDEARHAELFARVYHRFGEEPISIRRFPTGYLFQAAIISEDPGHWIVGSLVSECLAKRVLEDFRHVDLDPVLSEVCDRILHDEARHLAFNHAFIEDRIAQLLAKRPDDVDDYCRELEEQHEKVLEAVPPMFVALEAELKDLGVDAEAVLADMREDSHRRLRRSLRAARENGDAAPAVEPAPAATPEG